MQDHNEVSNQSVKDVLEDIKKVISNSPNNKNPPSSEEVLNLSNPENTPEVNDNATNEDNAEQDYNTFSNKQHKILDKIDDTIESTGQSSTGTNSNNDFDKNQEQKTKKLPTRQPNTQDLDNDTHSIPPAKEKKVINNNNQEIKTSTPQESLISKESAISTISEIKNLIQTIQQNRKEAGLPIEQGITIEEVVLSVLKPELSLWLDNHLPRIVKDIVEKEIKNLINNN